MPINSSLLLAHAANGTECTIALQNNTVEKSAVI